MQVVTAMPIGCNREIENTQGQINKYICSGLGKRLA
jgi:hypothetical protein